MSITAIREVTVGRLCGPNIKNPLKPCILRLLALSKLSCISLRLRRAFSSLHWVLLVQLCTPSASDHRCIHHTKILYLPHSVALVHVCACL